MSLTLEQQKKINNWKAQHNKILGELSVANKELEKTLTAKKLAREEIIIQKKELSNREKELVQIDKTSKARLDEIYKKNSRLEKNAEILYNKEKDVEEKLEGKRKEIEKDGARLDKEYNKLRNDISILTETRDSLETLVADLQQKVDTGSEALNKVTTLKREEEESVTKLQVEKVKLTEIIKNEIYEQTQKLEDLKTQTKEEGEKIGIGKRMLEKWEGELEDKENNIKVYSKRLRGIYKELFPHLKLKI